MLCGLLTPDAGQGTCLNYDLRQQADEIKKQVGYMTQRFSFYEDLTLEENLDFIARIYGVPHRHEAVNRSLDRLGMRERGASWPANFQGDGSSGSPWRPA